MGLPGIGLLLTSCQSAGGEERKRSFGLGEEKRGEDERSNEMGGGEFLDSFLPRLILARIHILAELIRGFFHPHISECVKGQSVHLLNYYFLFYFQVLFFFLTHYN